MDNLGCSCFIRIFSLKPPLCAYIYINTHTHTHTEFLLPDPLSSYLLENACAFLFSFNAIYCPLEKSQAAQKSYCFPWGHQANSRLNPRVLFWARLRWYITADTLLRNSRVYAFRVQEALLWRWRHLEAMDGGVWSRKKEGVQPGARSGKGWADKPMESSTAAEELLGNPLLKLSITSGSWAVPVGQAPGPERKQSHHWLLACLQLGPYFIH